ncbi:restriction endonuclease subunit S [Aliarcobacter lanthieri]|uniref:restriction endonuclease subunit S n=1 Tax=Aliarcobacter lanthieri TaxID=1355374 RepID=UPI003AA991BE
MKIINISSWKEFKLEELFDIHPTKSYKYTNKDLLNIDGNNPVIGNSSYNNGIIGYSIFDNTEQGNIITFSDTTSSEAIFYQKKPFIGYSHIQGMYPREKYNNWNEYSYLYILTIIKKAVTLLGVDYVNKFTRDMANNIIIKLPIKEDNSLNYEYMVTYMKNLEAISINYLKNLQLLELNNYKKIDLRKWRRFNLYDKELFTIDSGNKLDKAKMTTINPTINFVGRSNQNNGITIEVDEIIGTKPYKKGYMTLALGGEYLGSCFIQPKGFYTSQNVNVLIPNKEISYNVKLFISIIVFKEARTYYKAFVDELNRHIKTDFSILLPVNDAGLIDWEYMEKYINDIKKATLNKLKLLKNI